jgi:hypothetical protein
VTVETNPQVNPNLIEETRRQINRLFEEVGHLSEMDIPPNDYFGEFLKRALQGLAAPAGAVWVRNPQGHLQLQHQINLQQVGLQQEEARQSHDELLRQAIQQGRPLHVPPHSSTGPAQGNAPVAGNPTPYDILMVPIVVEQAVTGLVEVWQQPGRNPAAIPGFLQFLGRLAHLASIYLRNKQLRTVVGQQQLWTQLEGFARQVHGSLNPTEVSYMIVNEGRRLIECDRVSVGVRDGRKVKIEAVSGADVVEKRSNLIVLMRKLMDSVIHWGEKLVYSGTKDEGLPPKVLEALDNYLAESNSKLLVCMPLKDEREQEGKKPPRSALMMECFEPEASTEQLMARLDVVGRHAASALYNAVEHKRIPLRFLWKPIASVQEGLGGKTRAILYAVAAAVVLLLGMMIFMPYPLKMDATGHLLPEERQYVFSPIEAKVVRFAQGLKPGDPAVEGQNLVLMNAVDMLIKMNGMKAKIDGYEADIANYNLQLGASNLPASEKARILAEIEQKKVQREYQARELAYLSERINAEPDHPGDFWLKSPLNGIVLNWGFQEQFTNSNVKPSQPILRVGNNKGRWEIELKIPQKHIGQIKRAFRDRNTDELDVDLLLASSPTETFKGKLSRDKIAGEAVPDKEDPNASEPTVLASVRIDGKDIEKPIPPGFFTAGTEVHTKIRCGNHRMGYSLFYGLWEFFYEKVVFFF